jgi:hypothetical protein
MEVLNWFQETNFLILVIIAVSCDMPETLRYQVLMRGNSIYVKFWVKISNILRFHDI